MMSILTIPLGAVSPLALISGVAMCGGIVWIIVHARQRVGWRVFGQETGIAAGAYLFYFAVRGLTESSETLALANAARAIELEQALGVFHEEGLQSLIAGKQALVTLVNWIYIWGHWPVIATLAVWLVLNRPSEYRRLRNAFLISGGIGLVIFALFPVAPPRLTDMAMADTVTEHSTAYRVLQPPALTNAYAAVPSLHFGWNLLVGIALVRVSSRVTVRLIGVLLPVAMLLAIVLTANHYVIDAIAGAAVALAGWAAATRMTWHPPRLPARHVRTQTGSPAEAPHRTHSSRSVTPLRRRMTSMRAAARSRVARANQPARRHRHEKHRGGGTG